jgi:hypothetical protein
MRPHRVQRGAAEWLSWSGDEETPRWGQELDGATLRAMRREAKRENETWGELGGFGLLL